MVGMDARCSKRIQGRCGAGIAALWRLILGVRVPRERRGNVGAQLGRGLEGTPGSEGPLTDSQGLWLRSQPPRESSGGSARPSPGRSWMCWRLFSPRPATPTSSCGRRWP